MYVHVFTKIMVYKMHSVSHLDKIGNKQCSHFCVAKIIFYSCDNVIATLLQLGDRFIIPSKFKISQIHLFEIRLIRISGSKQLQIFEIKFCYCSLLIM